MATVMLIVGAAGCTGGKPRPAPSKSVGVTSDSLEAADRGKLRVADSTFQITTPADTMVMTNRVKYSVVLENSSKIQAAIGVHLTVKLLDAAGRSVPDSLYADGVPVTLLYVRPGQRFGVVGIWSSDSSKLRGLAVAKMEVVIKPSDWVPPDKVNFPLTMSDLMVESAGGGAANVTFAVDYPSTQKAVSPIVSMVYRDATGRLLGGDRIARPDDIPAGRSVQRYSVTPPPNTDLSKTEVYVAACCNY